jgi:hypothetical protein
MRRRVVVGAYAVATHARPRATGDMEAWPNRTAATIGGVAVDVIGREDLLRKKRSVGRARDLAAIETLTEADER